MTLRQRIFPQVTVLVIASVSINWAAPVWAAGKSARSAGSGEPAAEVQINLCAPPDEVVGALGLKPPGRTREVWYFDTPALSLFARGAVVRLRVQKDGDERTGELTIKAADQDCTKLDPALIPPREGKCEYDVHGDSVKGAVSLSRTLSPAQVRGLLDGRVKLAEALSPAQARLLRNGLGIQRLGADIGRLGPATLTTYQARKGNFSVDAWTLPRDKHFVEVSQKSARADAGDVERALRKRLLDAKVNVCADQSSQAQSKLRWLAP